MHLHLSKSVFFGRNESHLRNPCFSHVSACLETRVQRLTSAKVSSSVSNFDETKEKISKLIHNTELSMSTYDTAWVAMVPSPSSPHEPYFPNCLNWLLENQCYDGSWARPHHHSLLQKDVLSSTLACVLALKKWGVGEEQINRGVHFIESNFASAIEKSQISPMGFDIIFPTMLDYARDLFFNLRFDPTTLNELIHKRDQLKRSYESHSVEKEAYLAYVAEGMGKLQDWETVMKYQRKNGSLFNSPSTTAAAFMALPNSGCLSYLHSALTKFGNSVPAIYTLGIYAQLSTVDNLERLGISRYFSKEIQSTLDETYGCWVQGDKEIFMDASTCALAFRLLRMNGYNVTSDQVTIIMQGWLSSSSCGNTEDMHATLELYIASELILSPAEKDLEKQHLRLKHLLEQKLSSGGIDQEVSHALNYPFYATLDRIAKRQNIELYNLDNVSVECSSENVRIIFSALKSTTCDIGDKGFIKQERGVVTHIIEIWLDLLHSMMKEVEWARDKSLPTMDEYMINAYVSFALGPTLLPALYLVGPKLSEDMVLNSEYHNLFKLMSTCGRLLNDFQGYERELKDGTLNAVSLYITNSGGEMTKEDAITEMKGLIGTQRRELLRLVLERNNSVLPKACKDMFWHMSNVLHLFYSKDDGYTLQELVGVVNSIINKPIVLKELL